MQDLKLTAIGCAEAIGLLALITLLVGMLRLEPTIALLLSVVLWGVGIYVIGKFHERRETERLYRSTGWWRDNDR